MINEFCIIRTDTSGVHCGIVEDISSDATVVYLKESRRIWRWRGANTLNELALRGADETYTRISEPVPIILLSRVSEVLPVSPAARANLQKSRWSND